MRNGDMAMATTDCTIEGLAASDVFLIQSTCQGATTWENECTNDSPHQNL